MSCSVSGMRPWGFEEGYFILQRQRESIDRTGLKVEASLELNEDLSIEALDGYRNQVICDIVTGIQRINFIPKGTLEDIFPIEFKRLRMANSLKQIDRIRFQIIEEVLRKYLMPGDAIWSHPEGTPIINILESSCVSIEGKTNFKNRCNHLFLGFEKTSFYLKNCWDRDFLRSWEGCKKAFDEVDESSSKDAIVYFELLICSLTEQDVSDLQIMLLSEFIEMKSGWSPAPFLLAANMQKLLSIVKKQENGNPVKNLLQKKRRVTDRYWNAHVTLKLLEDRNEILQGYIFKSKISSELGLGFCNRQFSAKLEEDSKIHEDVIRIGKAYVHCMIAMWDDIFVPTFHFFNRELERIQDEPGREDTFLRSLRYDELQHVWNYCELQKALPYLVINYLIQEGCLQVKTKEREVDIRICCSFVESVYAYQRRVYPKCSISQIKNPERRREPIEEKE